MEEDFIINLNTNFKNDNSHDNQHKLSKKEKKKEYKEKQFLKNKRNRDKPARGNKDDRDKEVQAEENYSTTKQDKEIKFKQNVFHNEKNLKNTDLKTEKKLLNEKGSKIRHEMNLLKDSSETNIKPILQKEIKANGDGDELFDELENFYSTQAKKQKPKQNKIQMNNLKNTLTREIKEENLEIAQEKQEKVFIKKNEGVFSLKTFEDLPINDYLKKTLAKKNFETMTKIQKKSIPILLQHKNVIVKSETGSGKTLAYLIPVFEMLSKLNKEKKIERKDGPYVIILAPTHELCLQIDNTYTILNSACINAISGTLIVSFLYV